MTATPVYTLRGHKSGVTALAECAIGNDSYLLSGDDAGNIILWDLLLYRQKSTLLNVSRSRTQSLRVIQLKFFNSYQPLVIAQSRDDGIKLIRFQPLLENTIDIVNTIPSQDALFSRGDAINFGLGKAVLAYASNVENYLVAVRFLGDDATTIVSGNAGRHLDDMNFKQCSTFDIKLVHCADNQDAFLMVVGYEDGHICIYRFNINSVVKLPVINAVGLKIDLVYEIDSLFKDFISAFDLHRAEDTLKLVCGSPTKELISYQLKGENCTITEEKYQRVEIKRPGVSKISLRPDMKLCAVACWDSTIRLYSMKSFRQLAVLSHHLKQTQDILYINISEANAEAAHMGNHDKYLMFCGSLDGTISVMDIY